MKCSIETLWFYEIFKKRWFLIIKAKNFKFTSGFNREPVKGANMGEISSLFLVPVSTPADSFWITVTDGAKVKTVASHIHTKINKWWVQTFLGFTVSLP